MWRRSTELTVNANVYMPLLGYHVGLVVRFMTIIGVYDCSLFPSFGNLYLTLSATLSDQAGRSSLLLTCLEIFEHHH